MNPLSCRPAASAASTHAGVGQCAFINRADSVCKSLLLRYVATQRTLDSGNIQNTYFTFLKSPKSCAHVMLHKTRRDNKEFTWVKKKKYHKSSSALIPFSSKIFALQIFSSIFNIQPTRTTNHQPFDWGEVSLNMTATTMEEKLNRKDDLIRWHKIKCNSPYYKKRSLFVVVSKGFHIYWNVD